jgi:hypothetical protein
MMLPVRRAAVTPTLNPPAGAEISESKLSEMIASVHAAGDDVGPLRRALRVPVEGFARIQPLASRAQRIVGIYDMSRTGIAIVDGEPMATGEQFNVLFSREGRRPIEVLCTTRHTRRQGDAFIIGAEFGVSWLSAISAAML